MVSKVITILGLAFCLMLPSCHQKEKKEVGSNSMAAPSPLSLSAEDRPQVIIKRSNQKANQMADQGETRIFVELAKSPEAIRQGLMYRKFLPENAGMLFFMNEEKVQSFWMSNTLIALDIIFISKDKKIVGAAENAEPLDVENSQRIEKPSLYVLEVNGGFYNKHGLRPGDSVVFKNTGE